MRIFPFILICLFVIGSESLSGQCPDRDSVLNRITIIRSPASTNYTGNLNELLGYDRQLKSCSYRVDSVYTFLLLSIGVTYYRLTDYAHAIQYTKQALNIIHANANSPSINKSHLIRYYYYLSIYYDSLKLISKKNEAIDSCIANEIKTNGDYHYTSLVLHDNVRDLYNKGDYNLCVERSALGESLIHKYYRFYDSMEHIVYFIYYKANALRLLKKFYEEDQFLQSKGIEFRKIKNEDYTGIIYSLFGYLYESKGDYNNAIKYFQKAYDCNRFSIHQDIGAGVLNEIGLIYHREFDQKRLALQYYYKALAHAKYKALANGAVSDSFYLLGNVANVYVSLRLYDSAFYFFQKALDKIKPGMHESDLILDIENYVNANTAETVIKLVLDKANAYLQQYHYKKDTSVLQLALSVYKIADKLLDKIKDEQAEVQSRLFWQTDTRRLYGHAIEASYLQNNSNNAFYFFEKGRAVLLNEQLNQQSKITDGDILKQAHLKKRILILERERDTTNASSNHYIEIQKELIVDKQELDRLGEAIKQNNPLYFESFFDTSLITIVDVQKKILKDHQALLELFEGDSAVYSLLIASEKIYFNKISKTDFDSTTKAYNNYISNFALLNSRFDEYTKTANHLYRLIFPKNIFPTGRIIISPYGHYFPFESLVTSTSPAPVYFLNDHAVSYTYSARYLMNDFKANDSAGAGDFFGSAPVQFTSAFSLPALDGSDVSLKEIGSYFNDAKIVIAANATRNSFLQEYLKYKVIQLYTHATDSGSNGEPVIHFADSSLYLSDLIAENKPFTRLIVLSACETGSGKLYQGEGVFSFNRGFASLGIPSSITNLWSIDNTSTYRLTELFYKYLSKGMPVDIALQKAKLEFISASRQNRLPYYWAATIVAGKTDAIVFKKTYFRMLFAIIGVIAGSCFLLVWVLRKTKKRNAAAA